MARAIGLNWAKPLIVTALIFSIGGLSIGITLLFQSSSAKDADIAACLAYSKLESPKTNEDVPSYISNVQKLGWSAKTEATRQVFHDFVNLSTEYFNALSSKTATEDLADAAQKAQSVLIDACSGLLKAK